MKGYPMPRIAGFVLLVLFLLSQFACGDHTSMVCFAGAYRCAGDGKTLLQRCDSTTERWETLYDCEELGKVCEEGACVESTADGDDPTDGDEPDGDAADGDSETADTDDEAVALACGSDVDCPQEMLCVASFCEDGYGLRYDVEVDGSHLIYRNDTGRLSIYDSDGALILSEAYALIMLDATDEEGRAQRSDEDRTREVSLKQEADRLGEAERILVTISGSEGEPNLIWRISAYQGEGFYTFQLRISNQSGEEIELAKAAPLRTRGEEGGGLFMGDHPSTHRIWDNGSYTYFDFYPAIVPGDVAKDDAFAMVIPGDYEGHSVSNWSHSVTDLEDGKVWIAGGLTFNASSPLMNLSYDAAGSQMSPDGRSGFSYLSLEAAYEPHPKTVADDTSFSSEIYYVHPGESSPFEGLERLATKIKQQLDIKLWQERAEGNRVPNGWNSWSTSGSTGGYGSTINEEIILANLEVMAHEFRDWGMDWFQIDDGYEPTYGDWWWDEERFPHGPKWMSDQIRAKGLKPGLWMAPFTLYDDSETLQAHPDWIADYSMVGTLFNGGYRLYDLTHPEVLEYLENLFDTFRNEWGFEWLKMDFSYYGLMGDGFYDPSKTREEAYRNAVKLIKNTLGDDTFFLAVSAIGGHIGLVDSDRLSLDNMPVWDWEPSQTADARALQQGFKPTVRCAARRYFLHNRVWINHSDLIVFRSNTRDETWPRVTLEEAQAFASYVGLSGGIVKLGDKLVDLEADHINTVRKLLPIYEKGARPLDILEREFPEFWHLNVNYTLDGYDEKYDLVGLFNWGFNWDMTVNPYEKIADDGADRHFEVDLRSIGLDLETTYLAYEFWTESFLGEVESSFEYDVPAHTARVFALRRATGVPQFLGWNRQITMGATSLKSSDWNAQAETLTMVMDVAEATNQAPFTYRIAVHVPDDYSFKKAEYDGVLLSETAENQQGRVLMLEFEAEATGSLTAVLKFQ